MTLPPFSHLATRLVATVFWLQVTDQRRHSWLSEVYVHTDSVIHINQHNFQQSWLFSLHRNLYTVSTDSPVIMFVIDEVRDPWNTETEKTLKLLPSWWSLSVWLWILYLRTTVLSVNRKNLCRSEKYLSIFFHFWDIEVKYFAIV